MRITNFLLMCICSSLCLYAQPRNGPQLHYPWVMDETTAATTSLNATATWAAIGFVSTGARTLNEAHIAIASTNGTPASNDLKVSLYSNSGSKPNSEIEAITVSSAPTTGWVAATGFTSSVSDATTYWIVVKNLNGTPGTNYFSLTRRTVSISGFGINVNAGSGQGWMAASTTDSGTNWTKAVGIYSLVLVWSDGTKEGFPIVGSGTACQIYSARECGLMFRTGLLAPRVYGSTAMINKTSSPSGLIRMRLYEGTGNSRTLIGTTATSNDVPTSVGYIQLFFTTTYTLKSYTWYTLVLGETTQSDTSTTRYNMTNIAVKSDHMSLFSMGLITDFKYSITTDNGSTWTDTNYEYSPVSLLVDPRYPYHAPGGGFGGFSQ